MRRDVRAALAAMVVWTVSGCTGAGNAENAFQGTPTDVCAGPPIPAPRLIAPLSGATGVADDLASIEVDFAGTGYAIRTASGSPQSLGVAVAQAQSVYYVLALPPLQAHTTYTVSYTTGTIGSGVCAIASMTGTVGSFTTL